MNKKINTIIEAYLLSQSKTDYAIMINGKWGCGKTYYVENELKILIENKEIRYIYISLNGCDNFLKIINKITINLLLKNRFISNIDLDLIENLYNIGTELSELKQSINILFRILGSVKNVITRPITEKMISEIDTSKIAIIFDDIERISDRILLGDIIGQIYENYSKKGYKTIIVGDETNISDEIYHNIKEKVIRRTISYEPDRKLQMEDFINNKFNNTKYKDYVEKNKNKLIIYIIKSNIVNLRTIAFIIDNFTYIFDKLDKEMKVKYGDFIFKNIMLLTNEYKHGRITITDLESKKNLMNYPETYYMDKALRERGAKIKRTYIDDFHDRYLTIPIFEDFRLVNEIFTFILTGYLDIGNLENEIKLLFYDEYISEAEKVFNFLMYNLENVEEDELIKQFEKFIYHIKKGEYHISKLPYIYTFLKCIKDKNYLADWRYDIEEIIRNSLGEAVKNQAMIPEYIDPFRFDQKYYEFGHDDQFYNELTERIRELSYNKRINYEKSKIEEKYHLIISNDPLCFEKLNDNTSFFQDTVKAKSEYMLFDLTNRGIGILESYIYNRFLRINNAGEVFYDEKQALEEIIKYVELNMDDYSNKHNHLRIVRFKDLLKSMKDAVDHLEKTHNKN